ncbi:PREDICTED: CD209 antigen-like protein C [Branchiostoma belcheri]|uniref:CD209 antigen-like protein C n=1 Tax=Branchiostoma belcheri TaxID=7741 RepID=A0A6P4ZUE7_BRABE|nr:PREDICTED: CD209 antigen-like protein C [Branchiostoma belcheri]
MGHEICYKAFSERKSFDKAAAACRADGGTLAMPRDAETDAFLISLYKSVSDGSAFWFGLHDQREEGRFEWVDGSSLRSYSSWAPGEPDDSFGMEDCVSYSSMSFKKDKWNDENCRMPNHFICQAAPASCPKGYTMWRGTCYKAFKKMKTFNEAAAACREDGGTLAMPRDAGTDAFLISLYKSVSDGRGFWIGLHDQGEEGRFEWVDGSALGPYSSWSRGEPSSLLLWGDNSDCVSYSSRPFQKDKWTDENCSMPNHFICQVASGRFFQDVHRRQAGLSPLLYNGSPTIRSKTN